MAEIIAFQVAVLLFALFALSRVGLRLRERKLSILAGTLWAGIWIGIGFLALLPSILVTIAKNAGIGRGVDLLMYLSIGVLFYLLFKQQIQIRELKTKTSTIVSRIAVDHGSSQQKKKKGKEKQ